jgi:transcriptional regulator with PAS, ATPase and Fis domain
VPEGAAPLVWTQLLSLHALRTVAAILGERYQVGLGFAAPDGAVYPPRVSPPCRLVQSRPAGDDACVAHAVATLRAHGAAPPAAPQACVCHAGLVELSLPVIAGGEHLGSLLAGGLAPDELAAADRATVENLLGVAAREILRYREEHDARGKKRELPARPGYDAIIGRAPAMQELYRVLDKVVATESTVLVQGENGTGKELIAKAIHGNSARRDRRFIVQNCSAFNDNLLDSELFGHRRGAFTGAIADKMGLFEAADGGTFFLDEIGDMSPALQVKLLRVLQEGTFTPVGDTVVRSVDVRIIAATHRDLKGMVARGEFREDLYYRVNVINLVVPPLRERREDIAVLVEHFLKKHARGRRGGRQLTKGCLDRMLAYPWPGNVRELENEIERLVVLAGDERVIGDELLSPRIRRHGLERAAEPEKGLPGALAALERRMLEESLRRHRGNKTRAATELKISRRNLIRLAQKYGLDGS